MNVSGSLGYLFWSEYLEAMLFFEDLKIDDTFEFGSYTITRAEIIDFAERYDPQPFHLDEAAAAESMFGELIASGWHTASICVRMVSEDVFDNIESMGGRGVDDLRWHRPVRPNDAISGTITVVDRRPSRSHPGRGYVDFETTAVNQRGERILSMINLGMIRRRSE